MPEKADALDALLVKPLEAGDAKLPRANPDFAGKKG